MQDLVVQKSIDISALASKVWDVLTKPEYTKQYMYGCETVSDWKVGSTLDWKNKDDGQIYVRGKIVEVRPPHFLQYTTIHPETEGEGKLGYTTVRYELTSKNEHVTLSVSQGDFREVDNSEDSYHSTRDSWDTVLLKIKALSEPGQG